MCGIFWLRESHFLIDGTRVWVLACTRKHTVSTLDVASSSYVLTVCVLLLYTDRLEDLLF